MALIYYNLVKADRRTLEQVPENLRVEVKAMLEADAHVS
ncbi:CD1375 family protein [Brevibacillus borstelensis]|nr:CD1375 family protein [Brevibacillus borstelensis]MED2006991.1 CD1375 family protein [Brevibacillus borstelensis]